MTARNVGSNDGASSISMGQPLAASPAQRLAVIIVSYNVRERLRACLRETIDCVARASHLASTVWVFDNGSVDGSAEMVAAEFPDVRLVASEANLGFSGGNNRLLAKLGFGESSGHSSAMPDFVLLLNPDAEPQADAIGLMTRFLADHPTAGAVGARLEYANGDFQHGAFRFPDLWQLWFDLFPPRPRRLLESRLNGRYPRALYDHGAPFPVDFALGAALMVRRDAILEVGLLDEGYFMYAEEVDWCWRMRLAGWECYCVPSARVIHHGGASASQFKTESFLRLWRSRRRLYERFYTTVRRNLAGLIVRLGMLAERARARSLEQRGVIDSAELSARSAAIEEVSSMFRMLPPRRSDGI